MDPCINERLHDDDDHFYENMVDETYNPINYEFSDGDTSKVDCIDHLTKNSKIITQNFESTKQVVSSGRVLLGRVLR